MRKSRFVKPLILAGSIMMATVTALSGCSEATPETSVATDSSVSTESTPDETSAPETSTEETSTEEVTTESETETTEPETEPETPDADGFYEGEADIVTIKAVNIRVAPNTESTVLELVPEGYPLKRVGYSDEWTRIVVGGEYYYVNSAFVKIVGEEASTEETTPETTEETTPETTPETTEETTPETETPTQTETPEQTTTQTESQSESSETVAPSVNPPESVVSGYGTVTPSVNGFTVCIDAGHQAYGIADLEPNGPGSAEMKAKLTTGTAGNFTGAVEYQLNLDVSLMLKEELIRRGYGVVTIRESNDCPLSNAERAQVANNSGAQIFLRVHANSSTDVAQSGILTMAPSAANPYVANLSADSVRLSQLVVDQMCAHTGANNIGVLVTDTMTGINWCQIPVSIIEMGYMSNKIEDELMQTADYRAKLVQGMADGVDQYFGLK